MGKDGPVSNQYPPPGRAGASALPPVLRGAVDLSSLAAPRQQPAAAGTAPSAPSSSPAIVNVSTADFETAVIRRSMEVPVVVELWATGAPEGAELSAALDKVARESGGTFVLARVDVRAEPAVGQAFQLTAIPSVYAVIKGQPVHLFDGYMSPEQLRAFVDEVLVVAASNGVTGRVTGVVASATPDDEAEPVDPAAEQRDAAVDAIDAGDWDAAERAYRDVLALLPSDQDAQAGLALVQLLRRTDGLDPQDVNTRADADPTDVSSACAAADFAFVEGAPALAFERLVTTVRLTSGAERNAARAHLLGLFELAGDDPAVAKARLALANALF